MELLGFLILCLCWHILLEIKREDKRKKKILERQKEKEKEFKYYSNDLESEFFTWKLSTGEYNDEL